MAVNADLLHKQRMLLEILSQPWQAHKEQLELLQDSVAHISVQLGHRQLSNHQLTELSMLLRDPDAATRQQAASTVSLLAARSVLNQFRLGCEPHLVSGLVALLQEPQGACWLRGPAVSALTHLAANSCCAMQSRIMASPGALPALIELLHDTADGLSGLAALALSRLCENHPKNQALIGQTPGAVSGLVSLLAGPDSRAAVAARGALRRLVAAHPFNRARVVRAVIGLSPLQQQRVGLLADLPRLI